MHRPDDANDADALGGRSGHGGSSGMTDPRAERLWRYVEALKREGGPEDEAAHDLSLPAMLPAFPYRPYANGTNGTNGSGHANGQGNGHANGHANGQANGNGNGHSAADRAPDLSELAGLAAAVYRTMQADGAEVARTCPAAREQLGAAIRAESPPYTAPYTGEAVAASVPAAAPLAAQPWWRALVPARGARERRGGRDRRLVLACLLLTGLCAIVLALWVRNRALAPDAGSGGTALVGGASAQPAAANSLSLPGKQCK